MGNVALADLVVPYLLKGENLGTHHAALSAIRVTHFETASDDFGIAIRGKAEFDGRAIIDTAGGGMRIFSASGEAAPPYDPSRRSSVFDLSETSLDFELFVPREGSQLIGQGAATISATGFTQTKDVLDVWDALPVDPPPSDYPSSGFTLDLILDLPSLRPPFLHPAKMDDRGLLIGNDDIAEVSLILPRLRFRLAHGNTADAKLSFTLVSAGTTGLDDPGDIGTAELIAMNPPYAFIGGTGAKTWGIGFRKAVLDVSNDVTPPEILDKFGFGDDWSGLYLPELRVFIAPQGDNMAFDVGVTDFLLGFGDSSGVSGDFEFDLIRRGSGDLTLGARFFDADNKAYGIEPVSATTANVALPANTRMVVDVQGGMPPYITSLAVDANAAQSGRLFDIDLSANGQATLTVTAHDSASTTSGTPKTKTLTITATLKNADETLPTPTPQAAKSTDVTPDAAVTDPNIVIILQAKDSVTLSTQPPNPNLMWSVVDPPGGGETGPQGEFVVPIAAGETKKVHARLPATTVPSTLDYYFYFNQPDTSGTLGTGGVSTAKATSETPPDREPAAQDPVAAYDSVLGLPALAGTTLRIWGDASAESGTGESGFGADYLLARRRASAVRAALQAKYGTKFTYQIDPDPDNRNQYPGTNPNPRFPTLAQWKSAWQSHGGSLDTRRANWHAQVQVPPGANQPEKVAERTLTRPAPDPAKPPKVIDPPAPSPPTPPNWFRSLKVKARIVQSQPIAGEIDLEVDIQTAAEERLAKSGQVPGGAAPTKGQTLQNGTPLGPDNPADGITQISLLMQQDQATGEVIVTVQFGADPADKDGLYAIGWLPGQTMPADKDVWLTLLGAYLSFWPMLVDFTGGNRGEVMDAVLDGAALAIPGAIALIPWFRVERVILFGGEFDIKIEPDATVDGHYLFDVEADWSADIEIAGTKLVQIQREYPLAVRYKAIGVRFGTIDDPDEQVFPLRPVFDASKGFTIDVARGGSITVASPFDKFLKILAARLSRTNPLTFEVDIGCAVDLGVVTIDRAGLRIYLEEPMRPPELTAFGASVDIPGALAGKGYVELSQGAVPNTSKLGGQLDLTLRPISLRVAAAFEMQQVADPNDAARQATAIYVGLNVVLPVGIPLGSSGLGIFGFRGIFGMHYARNLALDDQGAAPALAWLAKTEGQPHLIQSPTQHNILWTPQIDNWSFGVGMLLGTMEGGFVLNLDGTLLLELPGPRLAILMNARIISPPPSVGEMGSKGGILAILEITPDHFLIGLLLDYDISGLIKVRVPVEAFFSFVVEDQWHFYLGQRSDPVTVTVLDLVKATGYLMIKGDGLDALPARNLPAIAGLAIGAGAAASFTWGDTGIGLYLRVSGGFDAVIGFDPFLLAGEFELSGELRLFIVSVGASATLDILVSGETDHFNTTITGKACGHVDFFFFSVEGCVSITIDNGASKPGLPDLVQKLSVKSRSPALLVGTGVDRPIDTSLGEGLAQDTAPAANDTRLPVVPIDSVLVLGMAMPPVADGVTFQGNPILNSTGVAPGSFVARGSENFEYTLTGVSLARADNGPVLLGSNAPATWWTPGNSTDSNVNAQLALLTWEPDPATKAVEQTDHRTEEIRDHWGTACQDAAPPTRVLWTFLDERTGPSPVGWDLEGLAWPDPPNTRRKQPPQTAMLVTEAWRSGDAQIDAMRGILPASVLGALVKCQHPVQPGPAGPPRPRPNLGDLLGRISFNPTLARQLQALEMPAAAARVARLAATPAFRPTARLLEKVAKADPIPVASDVPTVFGLLGGGGAVTRQQVAATLFAPPVAAAAASQGTDCESRVLQSPIFDDGRLIVFGNQANREAVKQALDKAGIKHGPLNDTVVLHTAAFQDADILLFVRREFLEGDRLVARTLAADGTELTRVAVQSADRVAAKPLPGPWVDPAGPWADDVADVLGWAQSPRAAGYFAVWITAKGDKKADRVEIGLVDTATTDAERAKLSQGMGLVPPYYLAAFDALSFAEIARADSEQTEILKERAVLTQILGPGPTDDAYLVPNQLYKVDATWTGKRQSDNATAGKTQTFWFRSDATPPDRLDPWVLLTNPADGEAHAFGAEPVQVVFNTHNVDRLFGAYGKELRIRFTASSANHPQSTPAAPHPFPLDATTLKPAGPGILSPWEDALQQVAATDLPCIAIDDTRVRQTVTDIPIALDPFTDYRMDVVMVDAGAPDSAAGTRIYRRSFSTGAYATMQKFAVDLQAVRVRHRAVEAGRIAALLAFFNGRQPQGSELDDQLRAAGLEASDQAPGARVVVLWEQSGTAPPQPAAILIDAPEPMWRSRPYPQKVADDTGPSNATRWVLGSREWLNLSPGSTMEASIAANGVIRAPGDQRALIVLGPDNRGKRLTFDLVRTANSDPYLVIAEERYPVFDVTPDRAPWEE